MTTFAIGGIDIACTVAGNGPPVVLLHGLAEDRHSWADVQAGLEGWRSHACDLRGHGQTTLGDAQGTLAQLGGDLIGFLEKVSGPAACVGYSLGGTIVLWAAAMRPDLVRHAVVVGTSSVVGRAAAEFFQRRIDMIRSDRPAFEQGLSDDTRGQLAHPPADFDAIVARRLAAVGAGGGYINAARAMAALNAEPLTPMLPRITCPVDVIGGASDAFCPRKAADIILGAVTHGTYHEIPGAGHLMSVDQPAAYVATIRTALARPGLAH